MFTGVHRTIYDAILNLWKDDEEVGYVSVAIKAGLEVSDVYAIESIRDSCSLYDMLIAELIKWDMRKRLENVAAYIKENNEEPESTYCEALRMLEDRPEVGEQSFMSESIADGLVERMRAERMEGANIITGISDLDRLVRFRKNQLITIAARPSCGKSALGGQVAYNAACEQGKKVAFFTLEMTCDELMFRGLSMLSGVGTDRIEDNMMSDDQRIKVDKALERIKSASIFMFDEAGITVDRILARCKQIKATHGLDLVVIDYLQLIKPTDPKMARHEQLGEITTTLKRAAKKLSCPIIQLAQINRDAAKANRRPVMSDLKGSGNIEEDSDIVLFIHPEDASDDSPISPVDIIIEKQRNGVKGTALKVEFVKPRSYFRISRKGDVF
jgi:replicative DNA helicase